MVSKYCDHLPLYRQSRIYARERVEIDRSTMGGWVEQADALLDPLVAALGRYVLAAHKVHADDTPVVTSRRNPATRSRHIPATVGAAEGRLERPR